MAATSPLPGTARVTVTRCGSHSVLTRALAASPVKVFATGRQPHACWVYAATLGGGLVGGDAIHLEIDVEAQARGLLATQASTKVYRSPRRSSQTVRARAGAGALLAVMPDPVVCFAGADFLQTQKYDLHADASLVFVDWLTSGRHAAGERWAFSRYESRTTIARHDTAIFHDAMLLQPELDEVRDRMDRFDVLLTAVLTGPLVRESGERIRASIETLPIVHNAPLVISASALPDGGTLIRMAGVSVEQVGRTIRDSLDFLCPLLGDDPWSRKW